MTETSIFANLTPTMVSEAESKTYELGYHLTPELEEADIKTRVQELTDLITREEGSILSSKEPKHTHLSYPIGRKQYSYFGTFDFKAPSDAIERINAQMKLQDGILRFLLTKKLHAGEGQRVLGEHRAKQTRDRFRELPLERGTAPAPTEQEEKTRKEIKTEEIEKEIEEVIKGL